MKAKPIETAPKDKNILLLIPVWMTETNTWVQGSYKDGKFEKNILDSDGCGCCAGTDSEPTHWCELPEME